MPTPTPREPGSAMTTRVARAARGWGVAVFATATAAVSHGLAGGTFPGTFGIFASLILAGAASSLLTTRKQSPWRLAAAVAVTQVMYHAVFSGMGDPTAPVAHHHSALPDLMPAHSHGGSMWLAHIVAGVVTLLVLTHAESALWSLARALTLAVGRLLTLSRSVSPLPAVAVPLQRRDAAPSPLLVVLSLMRYRGPPLASLAV